MNAEDKLDHRLKEFYDRVPDIEDALPFKDYLLKHEDSRMAWYLLGKQYAAKGQEAKANYCFNQAGEVYEAFENKALPAAAVESGAQSSRRKPRALLLTVGILLLLAGLAAPGWKAFAPGRGPATGSNRVAGAPDDQARQQPTKEQAGPTAGKPQKTTVVPRPKEAPGIISAANHPDSYGQSALGELLMQKKDRKPLLLVQATSIGKWNDWLKSGQPVASVTSGEQPDTSTVNWFNPKWCDCQPSDPGHLRETVNEWKPVQEEKAVFANAMARFREQNGKFPDLPQQLAGNYPSNHMAGWSEAMTEWFSELKDPKTVRDMLTTMAPGWPAGLVKAGQAAPSGAWKDLTEQPLEIIVDKTHHRLGVVLGKVLLRNYAVGLGGERTPDKSFVITEKVRNPNGKTDGAFGSRGMTLSDTRYGIHGTNKPESIGKDDSLGCIRMAQEDLEELYDLVPLGTKVSIMKGGLPQDTRVPPKRFRLPTTQDETNPRKVYDWLD